MLHATELSYVILIFALFIVPHFFHRLKIPSAVITLLLGMAASYFHLISIDPTISLMATIGISALFLFAGMEIDFTALHRESRILIQQIIISIAMLIAVAYGIHVFFFLDWRATLLISLAIVSPSTGFIIDSMHSLKLTDEQRFWVKAVAIGTEIVALGIMFIVLQSKDFQTLGLSVFILLIVIFILPFLFLIFAKVVSPHAPNADFAFFIMLAIICGLITKKLGAYYLIGAFIVGVVAQRFQGLLSNRDTEHTLQSLRLFSAFFIPFYFFKAGLSVDVAALLSIESLLIGCVLLLVMIPLRVATFIAHGRFVLGLRLKNTLPVALSVLPTLVFGLVLINILGTKYEIPPSLLNGLVIYTLLITVLPRYILDAYNKYLEPKEA